MEKTVSVCSSSSIVNYLFLSVRIYHRRGARRWRKVRRINGHAFVAKRLQVG